MFRAETPWPLTFRAYHVSEPPRRLKYLGKKRQSLWRCQKSFKCQSPRRFHVKQQRWLAWRFHVEQQRELARCFHMEQKRHASWRCKNDQIVKYFREEFILCYSFLIRSVISSAPEHQKNCPPPSFFRRKQGRPSPTKLLPPPPRGATRSSPTLRPRLLTRPPAPASPPLSARTCAVGVTPSVTTSASSRAATPTRAAATSLPSGGKCLQIWVRMAGQSPNQVSSAEAILVGALSSGVNAPTWIVLQITFLLLAFCFTAMLYLAFFSSDFVIVGHVLLLITIGVVLFMLLNRFLAETGFVPVEQQMQEMGIHKPEATEKDKSN